MKPDPILRDFPYQFTSDRLIIRGPLPGDGPLMHAAVMDSLDSLQPWMPWAMKPQTATEYEVMLRQKQLQFLARDDLQLLILLRDTQTLIGASGLHRLDWSIPAGEIGYWVRSGYGGKGYITEAVNAITDFGHSQIGLRRIEIRCDSRNVRSAAVARRCGFDLEGTLRHHRRHHLDDSLRDTLVFARVFD